MTDITIATWNVNSVKARLEHLLQWLERDKPDIVLLQELKCETAAFPYLEIEALGYHCAVYGEKSYNGVAILSKFPLQDIVTHLPGEAEDTHHRYIEAVVNAHGRVLRVVSVYVPNGQAIDSDKWAFKLRFFERLRAHLKRLRVHEEILVAGGDYNVAPYPADVYDPVRQDGAVCYHPEERKRLRAILYDGFYDAYRLANPEGHEFSWWDYRANALAANYGLRIDHLLLSPQAADRLRGCHIAKELRALERPSDHAPVVGKFTL